MNHWLDNIQILYAGSLGISGFLCVNFFDILINSIKKILLFFYELS